MCICTCFCCVGKGMVTFVVPYEFEVSSLIPRPQWTVLEWDLRRVVILFCGCS